MTGSRPTWSVGELSQACGLSVRVLRHWDEMGVVTPTRSGSGHRRYGPAEITRLYRALALRRTGLRLRQVADLLDEQDPNPAATLREHLDELTAALRRATVLRDRLATALDDDDDPHLLMKVIETMTMFEQYVHGYHVDENTRLGEQADTLVDLLHDDTSYPDGSTVLEFGCGVGAQTVTLAHRSPGPGSPASTCPCRRSPRRRAGSRTKD